MKYLKSDLQNSRLSTCHDMDGMRLKFTALFKFWNLTDSILLNILHQEITQISRK